MRTHHAKPVSEANEPVDPHVDVRRCLGDGPVRTGPGPGAFPLADLRARAGQAGRPGLPERDADPRRPGVPQAHRAIEDHREWEAAGLDQGRGDLPGEPPRAVPRGHRRLLRPGGDEPQWGDLPPPLYGAGPARGVARGGVRRPRSSPAAAGRPARPGPVRGRELPREAGPRRRGQGVPRGRKARRAQGRWRGPAGVSPRGRGTGRPAGEVVGEGTRRARRQVVRRGPLLCHPDRHAGRDGRGRRSARPPLPSPPSRRRSTASAAPCSAIGCMSTGDTPARCTNTAGRPRRSTSAG